MITRWFALLIPVVALAGCASGRTLRVAEGEETTTSEPVSLAPAPAAQPQAAEPTSEASPPVARAQDSSSAAAQGYAPYGVARDLDMRRIGQWTRTGIGEARRLVIKDANTWAQFWSELGVGDRPDVDFTRNVVVAAAAGQRPTGGYEIAVARITHSDADLTVEVVETTPGPNCMTTASLTQPVDVVVVPVSQARGWSFMERKEIRGCR